MFPSTPAPNPLDFVEELKEIAVYRYEFRLVPQRWKEYREKAQLDWKKFAFDEASVDQIPEEQGIYTFCIEPGITTNLGICYLMYVGETTRPLRTRFREYLNEMNDPRGRPQLLRLLQLYKSHLYFYCAVLDKTISPEKVEDELLSAFTPPTNTQLPAKVRRIEAAF